MKFAQVATRYVVANLVKMSDVGRTSIERKLDAVSRMPIVSPRAATWRCRGLPPARKRPKARVAWGF